MIDLNRPVPGFYQCRLVRGGPFVPARIWWEHGDRCPETGELMSDDLLMCEVNSTAEDPYAWWERLAKRPISEAKYRLMIKQRDWDAAFDSASPTVNTNRAIDLTAAKPIF